MRERPGKADQLALPNGESLPTLIHFRIHPVW